MGLEDDNVYKAGELPTIRPCEASDVPDILRIINAAAVVYKGVIPADRWHEPYMPLDELHAEIAAGVRFTGYELGGTLIGIMGIQPVLNVRLIRHAYVLPKSQGSGVGSKLINNLLKSDHRITLIGTWAAATWAIRFYERHGFSLVSDGAIAPLLQTYWDVPARQIETSVVLSSHPLSSHDAARLIANG